MTKTSSITVQRVREVLFYEPNTGLLRWRTNYGKRHRIGDIAGAQDKKLGYTYVWVDGVRLWAHRVAWAIMTGQWPVSEIDHQNRNRTDNIFCNLREATKEQNMRNTPVRSDNKSGRKGVSWWRYTRSWRARIFVNGRQMTLGYFKEIHLAAAAYENAAKIHFGDFAFTPPLKSAPIGEATAIISVTETAGAITIAPVPETITAGSPE